MSVTVCIAKRRYRVFAKYQPTGIFREDGAEQWTRIGYMLDAYFRSGHASYPDSGFEPVFFSTKKEALAEKARMTR